MKNSKGITLIALVVTIIVLLILAGISLAMLTGPNGLINKATQAGSESIIGEEKERVAVAYNGALTEKYKTDINATVTAEDIQEELNKNMTNATASGTGMIEILFNETNHLYYINQYGKITGPTLAREVKIVEIIEDGIGITNEGKVVKICSVDPNWDEWDISNPWTEMVIEDELDYINGVKKTYSNDMVNFIIDNSNKVYSWGDNEEGQLGIGNSENSNTPVCIEIVDLYGQKIIEIKECHNYIYVKTEQEKWYKEYIGE